MLSAGPASFNAGYLFFLYSSACIRVEKLKAFDLNNLLISSSSLGISDLSKAA